MSGSSIGALLREKSVIVEGVRDALLGHEEILGEEIEKLFDELETRSNAQSSTAH
jgi:hypothetical protein